MHKLVLFAALLMLSVAPVSGAAELGDLKVEHTERPLGIDVEKPRFSWQMRGSERGLRQSAFQIVVTDPTGNIVWDSRRIADGKSLNIEYAGAPLHATTRYDWRVTVWDGRGGELRAQSWFETGLMNPDPKLTAWGGATWIGGSTDDLVLYSPYLSIFDLAYTVRIAPGSQRAAVVFAANDPRMMDPNKNIYQLRNARNESYFKVELDVGAASGGHALLNVYRAGYSKTDDARQPVKSLRIASDVINAGNRHEAHRVEIRVEFGELNFRVDGRDAPFVPESAEPAAPRSGFGAPKPFAVNLNPAGRGGDFLTHGYLCELGFAIDPGQSASFSELVVRNTRAPNSVLFREDLRQRPYSGIFKAFALDRASGLRIADGAYVVEGKRSGGLFVADPSRHAMPMLRTEFDSRLAIKAARLYVTARGIYELYLNGQRVGDDFFNPGFTQYNSTHFYQTYDVTTLLRQGKNALGAMLGEGWWSGLLGYGTVWNHFGDRPSLLAKLVVTYADGSSDTITSNDRAWKYFGAGPVVYSSLYMGEVYDASREASVSGWDTAGYDDREWKKAVAVPLEGTAFVGASENLAPINYDRLAIVGQIGETPRIYQTLTARSVREVRPGVYVYDLGQNVVGVPRIAFADGQAGRRVTVRMSEMLYPSLPASGGNVGMIMTENYRAALSQDLYVMKQGAQTFQPRFTFHGFQYLELSGIEAPLPLESVQALAISSIHEVTASYESSNPKVNRLWSNLVWSNVDNFLSIPTDCPQRNERLGWSGDISVFSRTSTYLSNASPFLGRHLRAMRDTQQPSGKFTDVAPLGGGFGGVLWGSAGITVPWELYQQYADVATLREHYSAMVAYIDHLAATLDSRTGLSSDVVLGDWLGPQDNQLGPQYLATAYHVFDLYIMTQVAEVLGKKHDAERFRQMHAERKAFFNSRFVGADGRTLGFVGGAPLFPGGPSLGAEYKTADTQSSYAVPLALGVFDDSRRARMQRNLAATVERENVDDRGITRPKYSLMTGFIGTAWISQALSESGRADLAYRLLQNQQYPSWLYPIEQGATTIWERLNSYTVDEGFGGNNNMNSFNHYSFGAVGQWLMAYSLGIQRGEPGFQSFVLQPEPDPTGAMTWARGHYDSPYGRIESSWEVSGGKLIYKATVPANARALLFLPARSAKTVREGAGPAAKAEGVIARGHERGKAIFELAAGTYTFTAEM